MSTGKRLAKRSIIGTRVCAPGGDGKFYSGVIQAVKTPANYVENNNSINLTPLTRYTVRFDSRQGTLGKTTAEFRDNQLIGPGFQSVLGVELVAGQKCFVTYNGREVCGEVCKHHAETDEVIISIQPNGIEDPFEVQKRLEEVRLLESRKSARLAYQDTDFARLADMAGDRKRTFSQTIDMPPQSCHSGSRKRQPSTSSFDDNSIDGQMDECNAALVLMSLSCSPLYSYIGALSYTDCSNSSSDSSSNSSSPSHRSTPSPPPLAGSPPSSSLSSFTSDEGIVMDYPPDEQPRKKRNLNRIVFTCTWPSCLKVTDDCVKMEAHLRTEHFKEEMCPPSEQKLYFTKVELGPTSPPPTLSHQDMARPFHEDPDYQRLLVGNMRQTMLNQQQQPQQQPQSQPPPQFQFQPQPQPQLPHKQLKLSPRPQSPKVRPHSPKVRLFTAKTRPISPKTRPISPKTRPISTKARPISPKTRPISPKTPNSPRRPRGENKKCRKIYGMEHKEQWCTQCKWKKACSRFVVTWR